MIETAPSDTRERVITLNDDETLINYAKSIAKELRTYMVRVDEDFRATLFKGKIANAEKSRVLRRPARREAEGGSHCENSDEHQSAAELKGFRT